MVKVQRYVNTSSMPQIIQTKHGTSKTFEPGEATFDSWYSRFVSTGRDKIGRLSMQWVEVDESKNAEIARAAVSQRSYLEMLGVKPEKPAETPQFAISVKNEDGKHWKRRNGVYTCLHCEIFSTGSRIVMGEHLVMMHKIDEQEAEVKIEPKVESKAGVVKKPILKPDDGDTVKTVAPLGPSTPVTTGAPPAADAPRIAPPVADKVATANEPTKAAPVSDPIADPVVCILCQKKFKSKKGLDIHTARMHSKE